MSGSSIFVNIYHGYRGHNDVMTANPNENVAFPVQYQRKLCFSIADTLQLDRKLTDG